MSTHRVCHITTVHTPFDVRILHKECVSLACAGFDVHLICKADREQEYRGVNLHPFRLSAKGPLQRLIHVARAVRVAIGLKANVYHFHDPELLPAGVLLKLLTGAKIIYDVHEDIVKHARGKSWWPKWRREALASLLQFIEQFSQLFFDRVVCAIKPFEKKFGPKAVTVQNYPLLIDSAENAGHSEKQVLLYIGTIREKRGIWEMLEIAAQLKNDFPGLITQIVGPFYPPELEDKVRQRINALDLEQQVELSGQIDHSQISGYLQQATVGLALLHPDANYVTSLPTKMFEYMMFGLPVVVSDFPLWREIVDAEQCGRCVDAQKIDVIIPVLRELLLNEALRNEMGRNGKEAVLEKYNWGIEEKKLVQMYHQLLDS